MLVLTWWSLEGVIDATVSITTATLIREVTYATIIVILSKFNIKIDCSNTRWQSLLDSQLIVVASCPIAGCHRDVDTSSLFVDNYRLEWKRDFGFQQRPLVF